MHTKLNLKIHGAAAADRELLADNLKSQDGIKSFKIFSGRGYVGVTMDIDIHKISKQQVFDIIKISGDFKVEESDEMEGKNSVETLSTNSQPTKTAFALGLLAGLTAISLAGNIILGYILFKPDTSATDIWVAAPSQATAPAPAAQVQAAAAPVQEFKITKNDHVRGDFAAPVTLVEYSDFECPFCGQAYPTFKKLLVDYSGKVRLVYKHFPLSFHPNAQSAAEASECADEQGKFWEYHDKLFENQARGYSLDNFKQWAKDLGLNTGKFNDCLDTGKYAGKVKADEADGQKRGVQGTPATFVNGQLVSGAVPYESFKSVIDQILNK